MLQHRKTRRVRAIQHTYGDDKMIGYEPVLDDKGEHKFIRKEEANDIIGAEIISIRLRDDGNEECEILGEVLLKLKDGRLVELESGYEPMIGWIRRVGGVL